MSILFHLIVIFSDAAFVPGSLINAALDTFERIVDFHSWLSFARGDNNARDRGSQISFSPCLRELLPEVLGEDGLGRYPRLIESEFPIGMVSVRESSRNLHCVCQTDILMNCRIRLVKNSIPYEAVNRRLDRSNLTTLLPFFPLMGTVIIDVAEGPLAFRYQNCPEPMVTAIIQLIIYDAKAHSDREGSPKIGSPRRRKNSSPSMFRYTERKISKHLCNAGSGDLICPITHSELNDGDIVYVLRQDSTRLSENKSVICISAAGLRKLAGQREDGRFVDPFHRTARRLLSISDDFESYVIRAQDSNSFADAINTGMQTIHIGSSSGDPGPSNLEDSQSPAKVGLKSPTNSIFSLHKSLNLFISIIIIFTFLMFIFHFYYQHDSIMDGYIQLF